jgi:hypothetical protein
MRCEQIKDALVVHFGQDELPRELASHLEDCQTCRESWDELRAIASALPGDEAFALTPSELESAVAMVDGAIKPKPLPMTAKLQAAARRWFGTLTDLRPIPAAAAVALVLVVTLGTTRFEIAEVDTDITVEVLSTSAVSLTATENDIEDPDDATIEALLSDFTQPWQGGTTERLLDDITDDEYEYLLHNMDVGDLL